MNQTPVDAALAFYNAQINALIVERDRLQSLLRNTLPNGTAIWDVLTVDVRTSLKGYMQQNITTAQNNLTTTINQIGQLP